MRTFPVLLAAASLLAACAAAAQKAEDPRRETPEQYHGQLARMRLSLLYPAPLRAAAPAPAAGPASRLQAFASGVDPLLDDLRALRAYLREGLRDPSAVDEGRVQWEQAWRRVDRDVEALKPFAADGEAMMREPVPGQTRLVPSREGYRVLEDEAEFPSPEGERLHRAAVYADYVWNLREFLLRKSAESAHAPARAALESAVGSVAAPKE
jgi:hypothetical protein